MKYGNCVNPNCSNFEKIRQIGVPINDIMFTVPNRIICSECEFEIAWVSKEFIEEKMVIKYVKANK